MHETDVLPYAASPPPEGGDVWVFAPHPDDEVYGCGGTIALHRQAGHQVYVVVLTDGEVQQTPAAEGTGTTWAPRLEETRRALDVLGVTREQIRAWHLPDRGIQFDEALVERIVQTLRQTPAVVYAPSLWEAHPDHRACAMAVGEALRRLGAGYSLRSYEISAPLRLTHLIDITPVWALKAEAMACFESQERLLPYSSVIEGLNRFRATTIRPDGHAEAFEAYVAEQLARGHWLLDTPAARLRALGHPALPADQPLVSVLVRTIGRPSLARAVQSALMQTHPRVEVVVVDASAGHACHANQNWTTDAPVHWVRPPRSLGRSAAANAALDAAQGDWLVFLDDDDWLQADHIAKLVHASRGRHERLFYSDVACIDPHGQPTGTVFDTPYNSRELCYGNFLPIHGAMFARSLLVEGCRFDERFDLFEDWDFWLQVERHTPFVHVPGVSAFYLIGAGSGAGVVADIHKAREATQVLFRKWQLHLDQPGVFEELVHRSLERRTLYTQLNISRKTEAALLAQLASSREIERALHAQLATSREMETSLRTALHQSLDRVASLHEQLQLTLNSRSWRLTRPIRVFIRLLRLVYASVQSHGIDRTLRRAAALVQQEGWRKSLCIANANAKCKKPPPS